MNYQDKKIRLLKFNWELLSLIEAHSIKIKNFGG